MKNIEAEKIEIKDLLSREYFYRVPEYQRPYSWDKEHFTDLIEDLLDAKRDQEYFSSCRGLPNVPIDKRSRRGLPL